jgi:hypothetical protein
MPHPHHPPPLDNSNYAMTIEKIHYNFNYLGGGQLKVLEATATNQYLLDLNV